MSAQQQEWVMVQRGWLFWNTQNLLFFFPPTNVTRCQYVSVVLSHNCGHFNHAAGQIASFHLVWGAKRSDCRSDQLASNSWGPELLLHEQNFLSVAFLIRFIDLYLADVGCTNLESSRLYTPPENEKMEQIPLFLQHRAFSRTHMSTRAMKAEAPTSIGSHKCSGEKSRGDWDAEEKKNNKTLLGLQGKVGILVETHW